MSSSNTSSDFSEDLQIEQEDHFGQCILCGDCPPSCQCEEEFKNIYNERKFQNIMNTLNSKEHQDPDIQSIKISNPQININPPQFSFSTPSQSQPQLHLQTQTQTLSQPLPLPLPLHQAQAQTQTQDQDQDQVPTQAQAQAQDIFTPENSSKINIYSPLTQFNQPHHRIPLLTVYDIRNFAEINLTYGREFIIETNIFISRFNTDQELILKISSLKNTIYENFTTYFIGFNENYISLENSGFFKLKCHLKYTKDYHRFLIPPGSHLANLEITKKY